MNYKELIEKTVKKGIVAAKRDYIRKDQKSILKGSIAGFKACLGKDIQGLTKLLNEANEKSRQLLLKNNKSKKEIDKYWEIRGFNLEVEWVCNVVSAVLYNEGLLTIIPPTARGMITASEIVGVKSP